MKKFFILIVLFQFSFAVDYNFNQSGVYTMSANTESNASSTGNVITISASNVVLDFGGYRLNNTAAVANLDGIVINPNLQNITIKNGTIINFTNRGINIGNGCYNVVLENLTVQNCFRAIEFIGLAGSQIQNSYLNDCKILGCGNSTSADFIVTFSQCTKFRMEHCVINDTNNATLSTSAVAPLYLNFCSNGKIDGLRMINNRGNETVNCINLNNVVSCEFNDIDIETNQSLTSTLNGFNLSNVTDSKFLDIEQTQNTASSQFNGFLVTTTLFKNVFDTVLIQDCSANNVTGILTTTLINATVVKHFILQQNQATAGTFIGFDIENGISAGYFDSCLVQRNLTSVGNLTAFNIRSGTTSSGNTNFENCIAQRNIILTSGNFIGFDFNATTTSLSNYILRTCRVINNITISGNVTGFLLQNSANASNQANTFFDCVALGNTTNAGAAMGFSINGTGGNSRDVSFFSCRSQANISAGANNCDGFLIQDSNFGVMVNCTASHNSAPGAVGSGLRFATAGNNRWEVRECGFINNRGSTNANSFGINQVVGTSILLPKCIAYNNAITPPGVFANQANVPGGTGTYMNIAGGVISNNLTAGAAQSPWAVLAGIS